MGLAGAVEAFEREGLFARELNPDGILVDRNRGAILADYGIPAALVDLPTALRDPNGPYRSPEERQGREPTARSSVYSLGAILFSALTAARAPEHLQPQQARRTRDVPPTIESVIAQAMAADPGRRYADVTEMARAAVEVVRARDRIGRMEAPAPQKQKPSRTVPWRAAQDPRAAQGPAVRRLSAVAPLVTNKAAEDAERREQAEQAAQREREEADARRKQATAERKAAVRRERARGCCQAQERGGGQAEGRRRCQAESRAREAAPRTHRVGT